MEATIIITDGASIINSIEETKKNKSISGTVVKAAEKQNRDDNTMQKRKSDGQTWYAMRLSRRDTHLYVFLRRAKCLHIVRRQWRTRFCCICCLHHFFT